MPNRVLLVAVTLAGVGYRLQRQKGPVHELGAEGANSLLKRLAQYRRTDLGEYLSMGDESRFRDCQLDSTTELRVHSKAKGSGQEPTAPVLNEFRHLQVKPQAEASYTGGVALPGTTSTVWP